MVFKRTVRFASWMLVPVLMMILLGAFTNVQAADCCQPPDDLDYPCDQLPYGFDPYDRNVLQSLFGEPVEQCSGYWYEEKTPEVDVNNCRVGTITRKFDLVNGNGRKFSCSQLVTITGVHDYQIYFPKDASAYCEAPDPEPLIKRENACDLLAVSKTDALFGTSSSGCYKILRTYRVINWCTYDGESPFVQVGRDEDCNGISGDEGVWLIRRKNGNVFIDRDDDIYNLSPSALENSCTGTEGYWKNSNQEPRLMPTGAWQYTQHIKVFDNVQPEIVAGARDPFCSVGDDCEGPVEISFEVSETCSADDLVIKVFLFANGQAVPLTEENNIAPEILSGSFPNYSLGGRYPLGEHLFEVHVKDGCGNTGIAQIPFSVVDCKAPTPICYHGISMALLPVESGTDADGDGEPDEFANIVWVSDLLRSEVFDCSTPITYSMNRVGETPDPLQDHLILTCTDADTVRVEVYAWDSANNPYAIQLDGSMGGSNYDYCETYIAIRGESCPAPTPPARITGRVKTFTGMAIDQVEIRVTGGMEMMQMTDEVGSFLLNVMPEQSYFLKPYKDDDYMNAISTRDIVVLTNHIMGRKKLDNPYQMIAADVNNSGSISILDLVYLRKALLGDINTFPNNQPWRFIPASYIFPDPFNPWMEPFPEKDYVGDMTMLTRWANFYAIKVGDVDNSISGEKGRSLKDPAYIAVEDMYLEAGQRYELPFSIPKNSPELAAMQFELFLDPSVMVVESVEEGLLTEGYIGQRYLNQEGILTVSWNSLSGLSGLGEGALFTLHVQPQRSGYLHDVLRISERRISAEGYTDLAETYGLQLQFDIPAIHGGLQLDQNFPNPFNTRTQIRFKIAEAGPARIQVMDLNGRLLYSHLAFFEAGEQMHTIYKTDLNHQNGVLLYTLETNGQRLSRKMVLLP